jgi:hypothetical protein
VRCSKAVFLGPRRIGGLSDTKGKLSLSLSGVTIFLKKKATACSRMPTPSLSFVCTTNPDGVVHSQWLRRAVKGYAEKGFSHRWG